MFTISQTFTADHTVQFDAALRDARTQLPRPRLSPGVRQGCPGRRHGACPVLRHGACPVLRHGADEKRADRGLVLALNQAVSLESDTIALVRSGSDAEVVYRVHSRGGCDCVDAVRRREAMPEAAPGVRACKHHLAAILTAMAHLNLAIKGYQPEAEQVWYPAVALDEEFYGTPVRAQENADGSWWAQFYTGEGGFYTDSLSLELWERTPEHVTAWTDAVRAWERWLQG